MESRGKKGDGKKADPGWEHGERIPSTVGGIICKYYQKSWKSGGVTRLKFHLTGTIPRHNVAMCDMVPPEVKDELIQQMKGKSNDKVTKEKMMEYIRAELREGIFEPQVIEDSDDSSNDGMTYPPDIIDPRQRAAYKKAFKAARAEKWEKEQYRRLALGSGAGSVGAGGSTRSMGPSSIGKRSQSMREPEIRAPPVPSYYKTEKEKQISIKKYAWWRYD